MPDILNPERVWQVNLRVEEGEERIRLYEARERLVFKGAILERLLDHASNKRNYAVANAILSITSPEGDEYVGYAMFMVMFKASSEVGGAIGLEHKYLFGVLEDGNIVLVAASDAKLNQERFLQSMGVAVERPDSVDVLILAFPSGISDSG